jgi:D-alanyl-D-alanine carboxypeptidase (penicillin-binding protein 5/6)
MTWDREWKPHRGRPRRRWPLLVGALVLVLLAGAAAVAGWRLSQPLPSPTATLTSTTSKVPDPPGGGIPWPTAGEAALSVPGVLSFPPVGGDKPLPVASIAKVMATLVLLRDHPIAPGQQGPSITITPADVVDTMLEAAAQDSIIPLTAGEQLTEYQAIEAMLVPSADNVADVMAQWDAGSMQAFVGEMNALAAQWGLTHTHFADASGLSPQTVSTASDLLALGQRAMANPLIASIVAQPSVLLPDMTKPATNYNYVIGVDGIVGIKTGYDTAAGGCFLFAAEVPLLGKPVLAYGAVLGEHHGTSLLDAVEQEGVRLVRGLRRVLGGVLLARRGVPIGTLTARWQPSVRLSPARSLPVIAVPGTPVHERLSVEHLVPGRVVPRGAAVGRLTVKVGPHAFRVPVVTDARLGSPATFWRLLDG